MIKKLLYISILFLFTKQYLLAKDVSNDIVFEDILHFNPIIFNADTLDKKSLNYLNVINNNIHYYVSDDKSLVVLITGYSNSKIKNDAHTQKIYSHILKSGISKNNIVVQSKSSTNSFDSVVVSLNKADYDKDKDGVAYPHDKCPDTKPDVKVASDGCKAATIIMLLDNDKENNAIVVQTGGQKLLIDKPGAFTLVTSKTEMTTELAIMPKEEMQDLFGDVVTSSEEKEFHFTLYFDGLKLVDASKQTFQEILDILKERDNYFIKVVGHTDTIRSREYNIKLSEDRADIIINMLLQNKIKSLEINKEFYGESNLAVKTEDDINEPLNRRVELFIY